MAKLYYYYGTMGSGKSLQLLATAYNFEERKIPFVILKSEIDTRDGKDIIHSRAGMEKECVGISKEDDITRIIADAINIGAVYGRKKIKWILVDEAQFLTAEQVDQLAFIVDQFDVNVQAYGLRTDFKTNLFEGSKRLFEVADTIMELKSSCDCGEKTIFNARVDKNGNVITDGEQIQIGGDESYTSMCRKCYYEKINKKNIINEY